MWTIIDPELLWIATVINALKEKGIVIQRYGLSNETQAFITNKTISDILQKEGAGLEDKKGMYSQAVSNLADKDRTTLILVLRPEKTPLLEAERSSMELSDLGINNQLLIINGVLDEATDTLSQEILAKQQNAIENLPQGLKKYSIFTLPLRSYNILGLENIRVFFHSDNYKSTSTGRKPLDLKQFDALIDDLYTTRKKVIFTMGKGGVGKTTIAATIALALVKKGVKVNLTSTDPADHFKYVFEAAENITISKIDAKQELLNYQEEVLSKARETMSEDDVAYIEELLISVYHWLILTILCLSPETEAERQWLKKVKEISKDNFVAIPWLQDVSIQNICKAIN